MVTHIIFGSYCAAGLVICLTTIPLIRGRVGPNNFYGIRTKASRQNDAAWYHINKVGGTYLLVAGLMMSVLSALVYPLSDLLGDEKGALVASAIPLAPLALAVIALCKLKVPSL